MNIAIISNGPSARDVDASSYDCVIAVNKAATIHRTTWWVVSDADAFIAYARDVKLQPRSQMLPQIFTRCVVREHIRDLFMRPDLVPLFDMMPAMMQDHYPYASVVAQASAQHGTAWNQWSGLAALGLAWLIQRHAAVPCRFALFGYDLAGVDDCLGKGNPKEHHSRGMQDRWPRERAMTKAWLDAIRY